MKTLRPFFFSAVLCALLPFAVGLARAQVTGAQQLSLIGLLGSSSGGYNAQFTSAVTDASGNLYLLLDQGDGIRILKTDSSATTLLAHAYIGGAGDSALAAALDPSGNLYITGTTTSGSLPASSGAAFPSASAGSTNSFIGKFDQNLNEVFLSYTGAGRMNASAIAATADSVFITGNIFSSNLPVTPSGIIQTPAAGSLQNGFVERFSSSGVLVYATYLSGQNGNTAPSSIAADQNDDAFVAGYTTSTGYPTLAALVPDILSPTTGFLTKLTPAGDGLLFSTFVPGATISALVIDPATQTLLAAGNIAPGQFPIMAVGAPLASATYETVLRLPLDGSSVISSTMLAPGTSSVLAVGTSNSIWLGGTLNTLASLLPLTPLSTAGNSYAIRMNDQNPAAPQIDQTARFGGLPQSDPAYASMPVTLTGVALNASGNPFFVGMASPTASASLLSAETWDLPLYEANGTPSAVLPSNLRSAVEPAADCTGGSLCSGSAGYLAMLSPGSSGASLALSVDGTPNVVLRNLGSAAATGLNVGATGYTVATDCMSSLAAGTECNIALTGTGPGTITVQAANASAQTAPLPATANTPNPIAVTPHEVDFGIETSTSPAATRTITVTNMSQQPQTFISTAASNQITPYGFAESSSDCVSPGPTSTKALAPGASCHITLSFTASSSSADDGLAGSWWSIGSNPVQLSGYTQAASLNLSATEIDFGTQFAGGIELPRYLYVSNNSSSAVAHTQVTLSSPFALIDRCPSTLAPHTVCQIEITYHSAVYPSADSTTLMLDESNSVLITGATHQQPAVSGQSANPNLTVTPTSIPFPTSVPVATTSPDVETVTIGNTGPSALPITLQINGDFTFTTDCSASLPAGTTCSATLGFTPTQAGVRQGIFTVASGASFTPVYVSLSGTATGILGATNATIAFGNVAIGVPSVAWYKVSTSFASLTASSGALDFKAILVEDTGYGHGQPSASAFSSSYTGSCRDCWLGVQFTPSSAGAQATTLTLTATGAPSPITLTGTGVPVSGLVLSPASQDFGSIAIHSSSAPQLFTLSNLTAVAVSVPAPQVTGDFAISATPTGGAACSGSLAPYASCFVNVAFTPSATGQRNGTLSIGSNVSALTGFGTPDPGLALNPAALVFNNVPEPQAIQQTITLTNTGSSALTIAAPATGTASFSATTNCTSLAPAAICTVTVIYIPGTSLVNDTLLIPATSSTVGLTTYQVPLTGAYSSETVGLQILPAQAEFGAASTETVGGTRQFTINNLTSKALSLAINMPRQFALMGQACGALAPNASCNFTVAFLPLTNGDMTGTIFAQGTPSDGSATLNGLAYLEGYGNGQAALEISGNIIPGQNLLNFGQVSSGQSSSQTVTLTNVGTGVLTIRRMTSQWPFLVSADTCTTTLAVEASCTVTITYSPLNQVSGTPTSLLPQANTGSLVIESDSTTGPDEIDLASSAVPVAVASASNAAPLVSFALSENSLSFPQTQVGDQAEPQTITLSNTGTVALHISAANAPADFLLTNGCATVLPAASCTVVVSFAPQPGSTDTRIGALEIFSDSSDALEFVSLYGDAPPNPLMLSPASLNFGSVEVGASAALPVQVTNSGATPAFFDGLALDSTDYTATSDCPTSTGTLAPETSCTITVTFSPTTTGIKNASLGVSTSLSTLPIKLGLTGVGAQSNLTITPTSLNFGSIALGASTNLSVKLANTGTAAITGLALSITGDYTVTTPCAVATLAPGASCTATITFAPSVVGERDGILTVASSTGTPVQVPLTGNGVSNGSFVLTVNGGGSATVTTMSERPATYSLAITPQNGYTGDIVLNCTPVNPGQYATCSLLPSGITLAGATQNGVATINTITTVPASAALRPRAAVVFCALPGGLLLVLLRRRASWLRGAWTAGLLAIMCAVAATGVSGCGGTKINETSDPSIRATPPGTYQYQVTASSATGVPLSQSVTLNLIVTAKQ